MKKIFIIPTILFSLALIGVLYAKKSKVQTASVYVCGTNKLIVENAAMARVSRKELYSVSYCTCDSADSSMKERVKEIDYSLISKFDESGTTKKSPKRNSCESRKGEIRYVFICTCVGKTNY